MDEIACNYDSLATYEPSGSCEFAEVGLDCDGNEFPTYFDVELDYNTSGDLCNFANDYNDGTVGPDYPQGSWLNDGGDMGYAFVSDGSSVSVSLSVITGGSFTDGQLNIYNGNPLDTVLAGTLLTSEYQSSNEDFSLNTIFETDSGSTYFVILDSDNWDCYEYDLSINSLEGVGGCTDELASNYDADATVDDESCIYCDEGSVDVTFAFNQENVTSDEVYVYNQETNDTVFSVEPFELPTWAGKDTLTCVTVGCYIISMGATTSAGWTDGSQLQILDDLTSDYFFLEVDGGALDLQVVSIGGAVCTESPIGGCMDPLYDN